MNSAIVDKVIEVLDSKEFEENESISKYLQALEEFDSLRDKGLIKERGNTLLPIEERYKSIYSNRTGQ